MLARENPFATQRVEHVLRFDPALNGTSWEAIEQRWLTLNRRASLVAHHGAGKTTFIDAFEKRLLSNNYEVLRLFLNTENPKLTKEQWAALSNNQHSIVILDGEEQLGPLAKHRFHRLTRHSTGLLVSCHHRHTLPTLLEFNPSIKTLEACVQKLAPHLLDELSPHFESWWSKYRGNLREILLQCYDHAARI